MEGSTLELNELFDSSLLSFDDQEVEQELIEAVQDLEPEIIIGEQPGDKTCPEDFDFNPDLLWSSFDLENDTLSIDDILDDHISDTNESYESTKEKSTDGKIKQEGVCPYCKKNCNNLRLHKCKVDTTHACEECGKELLSRSSLTAHKRLHQHKTYTCEVCDRSLTTLHAYLVHQQLHLDIRPYDCDFCARKFVKRHLLEEHRRIHLDIRPFECDICEKTFVRKGHLDLHRESHFPQYKCDLCDRVFTRNGQLKEHLRIHTGERPFKCEVCGKVYARKTRLKYHKCDGPEAAKDSIAQFQFSKEAKHVCDVCNRRFLSETELETHKDTHKPRFKCDICGKLFTRKAQLAEHSRSHSGDKPFKCLKCGKDYTRKIRLKRHECKRSSKPAVANKTGKTDEAIN